MLNREEVALVVLSMADGRPFTPVQIQKAMFLACDKVADAFHPNSKYDFQPYDYGPFDRSVYLDVERLEQRGLVQIKYEPGGRFRTYAATKEGTEEGKRLASNLTAEQREMLKRIVDLVLRLSFKELVSAIYRAYPPMRERSVFQD
jgi:uncharacterized protein YwgA